MTDASPLKRLPYVILVGVALLLGVAFITLFSPASNAHAASTVTCSAAVCSATSTQYAVGDWRGDMAEYGARTGTTPPRNPPQRVFFSPCGSWNTGNASSAGGARVYNYPANSSGSYTCWANGGTYGITACPPLRDRASNGLLVVYRINSEGRSFYSHVRCLYPIDSYAPVERKTGSGKVYTGGAGSFFNTGTGQSAANAASTYGTSGTRTDTTGYINRNVDLSNPERFTGEWSPSFNAKTGTLRNGDPMYGYYRLAWNLDYRICDKWEYPSWIREPARYDCARSGQDRTADPFTYACDSNPPLRAGIHAGTFTPSACNKAWQCVADNDLLIGGLKDTITILRNGEAIPVTNPKPRVTQVGDQVRNPRWEYRSELLEGSTPYNFDVKVDHKDQWFYSTMSLDNKWLPYKATDEVAFYWASDGGGGWQYQQQYAFTGEFLVPAQANVNGGSSSTYATDRVVCSTTEVSPKVIAVRSVNSP